MFFSLTTMAQEYSIYLNFWDCNNMCVGDFTVSIEGSGSTTYSHTEYVPAGQCFSHNIPGGGVIGANQQWVITILDLDTCLVSGDYSVPIENLQGTQNSYADTLICCNPTAGVLPSEQIKSKIHFYPNPTEDILFFKLEGNELLEEFNFSILNHYGQSVLSGKLKSNAFIDLNHIESGMYYIKISNNKEQYIYSVTKN